MTTIVIGVNNHATALEACSRAVSLAGATEARVHLVCAIDERDPRSTSRCCVPQVITAPTNHTLIAVCTDLDTVAARLDIPGTPVEQLILDFCPASSGRGGT